MAADDKRKDPSQGKSKKPKPLIKLNGDANERYDSYGYRLDTPKPPAAPSSRAPAPKETQRSESVPKRTQHTPDNEKKEEKRVNAKTGERKKTQKPVTERKSKDESRNKEKSLYGNKRSSEKNTASSQSGDAALPAHEKRISQRSIKRRKNLKTAGKVCIFVILVVCIIALIFHNKANKAGNENTPRTAFLSSGTIENSFSINVNFVREENTVYAGFSGKLIAAVNEGDRVAAGNVIAYVVKPGYENDLRNLRNIDNKITAAKSASSYVGVSQSGDVAGMNENINELTLRLSAMSGVTSDMREYSDIMSELDSVFRLKNELLVNAGTADEYINGLKSEREAVLSKLSSSMYEIRAEHAGIVSFYVDTSNQNAADKASAISSYLDRKGESGNMLSESALSFDSVQMRNMQNADVGESDIVARITPDVTYYMTADITGVDYSRLVPGKKITVKGTDRGFTADATVEEILKYGDKQYILMKSSSGISGAISKREVQSDIVVDYSSGIKVPKRALADWDSAGLTARVTIVRANIVRYVYVNILAEDSEYAIISNSNGFGTENETDISTVRINDLYVVNYETVRDEQILGD